ncbi:MAG: hypothetical protein VX278_22680 [Myxococcota bacterium]|nr:hypothetical protein [Myxococcota bacterium]
MNLALIVVSSAAYADSEAELKAERRRLSEEMKKLAKKSLWSGVDKKYRQILKLKKVSPSFRDHYLGSQAAYNIGNMGASYKRAKLGYELGKDNENAKEKAEELRSRIKVIEDSYAPVRIEVSKSYKENSDLNIKEIPFMPEEQDAVKYAQKAIKENKRFKGLLPFGEYSIGDKQFELSKIEYPDTPDELKAIAMSIKIAPPPAPPLISYMGPRVVMGMAYTQATSASGPHLLAPESEQYTAVGFGGAGFKLGLGWQVRLRFGFDIFGQLDFHNLMFSQTDIVDATITSDYGLKASKNSYRAGMLLGGISYPIKGLNLQLAGTLSQGVARVQGLATEEGQSPLYDRICSDNPEYAICNDSVNISQAMVMRGNITSGGVAVGASYDLLPIGKHLNGGLGGFFGAQTDTSRLYFWGNFALTITPSGSSKK